jgi:hypothetical protein
VNCPDCQEEPGMYSSLILKPIRLSCLLLADVSSPVA